MVPNLRLFCWMGVSYYILSFSWSFICLKKEKNWKNNSFPFSKFPSPSPFYVPNFSSQHFMIKSFKKFHKQICFREIVSLEKTKCWQSPEVCSTNIHSEEPEITQTSEIKQVIPNLLDTQVFFWMSQQDIIGLTHCSFHQCFPTLNSLLWPAYSNSDSFCHSSHYQFGSTGCGQFYNFRQRGPSNN